MITLTQLEKLAHISVFTVAKVFSGSNENTEHTWERIFEIAVERMMNKMIG